MKSYMIIVLPVFDMYIISYTYDIIHEMFFMISESYIMSYYEISESTRSLFWLVCQCLRPRSGEWL